MVQLHVCTLATKPKEGLDRLLESCHFHNILLTVMGMGKPFRGCGDKLLYSQELLNTLPDDDILLYIDAYDILIVQPTEKILNAFLQMKANIVVSAERFCHPDKELASQFQAETSFKYICAGAFIGYVKSLKTLFNNFSPIDPEADDQRIFTRYYLQHPGEILIDTQCRLFLPAFGLTNKELLIDMEHGPIYCQETGTYPPIIHAHGKSLWGLYIYEKLFTTPYMGEDIAQPKKKIFLSILVRDDEDILPQFLEAVEALQYDKSLITLYINVGDSRDDTKGVLEEWINRNSYAQVIFDSSEQLPRNYLFEEELRGFTYSVEPYKLFPQHFKIPASLRNRSLERARQSDCELYFSLDCDVFLAPGTLKYLVNKGVSIISPKLKLVSKKADDLSKSQEGTVEVSSVHNCFLVQAQYLDKLYFQEETHDFAESAMENLIPQYLCSERNFGDLIYYCDFAQEYSFIHPAAL
jgi:hypothetical protein